MSWLPIVLSIAALGVAPLIIAPLRRWSQSLSFLDGFIFVAMSGLVLLDVLPQAVERAGWAALLLAGIGLMAPAWLELTFRHMGRQVHLATLTIAVLGMLLHAAIDGFALNPLNAHMVRDAQHHASSEIEALSVAIILHRLPVGLTLWWILRRRFSLAVPVSALLAMSVATIVGYTAGLEFIDAVSPRNMALLQALVSGLLLHVVFHRPHPEGDECTHQHAEAGRGIFEGSGAVLGVALVFFLIGGDYTGETGHGIATEFASRLFSAALFASIPVLVIFLGAGWLLAAKALPQEGGRGSLLVARIRVGLNKACVQVSDRAAPWVVLVLSVSALPKNLISPTHSDGGIRRLQFAALGVFLILVAGSVLRRGPRHFVAEIFGSRGDTEHD